jgi:2-desacetyl-2-hydroxyethyl bacteriochlorophyllide A dehydrogenase
MKIKAIVFEGPNDVALRDFEMPPCGPKEIVTETLYSFVSPGTELRVLSGLAQSKGKFPLIPGYSWVGRVIEVGPDLKGWRKGDLVSGRHGLPLMPNVTQMYGGQVSHNRCEVAGDAVVRLPDGAEPWDYVCAEVAAISWRGISAAFPAPGESAVVVGQGLIGAFSAKWLLVHGAKVIAVDLDETRLARARKWGAIALNANREDLAETIQAMLGGRGADIAVEASGSQAGAKLAAGLLRQPLFGRFPSDYRVASLHTDAHSWPRLVLQASYYNMTFEVPTPAGLMMGEGALVLRPQDRGIDDRLQVIERIRAGDLKTADIVDAPVPVAEARAAYFELRDHPGRRSALAFQWAR